MHSGSSELKNISLGSREVKNKILKYLNGLSYNNNKSIKWMPWH